MSKYTSVLLAVLIASSVLFLPFYQPLVHSDTEKSAVVEYPPEITTDYDKLCVIYSILEQMRLEHNEQGKIARSDWKGYKDKWANYAKAFKAKQLPLLQEQNRLRDKIRRERYTDAEWEQLVSKGEFKALENTFGNRTILKAQLVPDGVKCDLLDELKAIELPSMSPYKIPDPTEDFTTYDELDENTDITVTASKITVDTMRADAESYVRKAHAISGDFEHLVHVKVTAYESDCRGGWWAVADGANSLEGMNVANKGLAFYVAGSAGSVVLIDYDGNNYDVSSGYFDSYSDAYNTISRTSTTGTCKLYSDADRTSLEDTVTTTFATDDYSHIYGVLSYDRYGEHAEVISGETSDLDLQEAEPEITNTPSTQDWDTVNLSANSTTAINYFTVTNTGSGAVDVTIQGTDFTGGDDTWDLSDDATIGDNVYGLKAGLDDDDDTFDITVKEIEAVTLITNLAESDNQSWGLQIFLPSAVTGYNNQEMTATLTLVASEHT